MTIKQALKTIMSQPSKGNMAYAQTYAKAGLELGGAFDSQKPSVKHEGNVIEIEYEPTGKMMVGEEMKVQILYVLANLGGWRGEEAREVKAFLKEVSK